MRDEASSLTYRSPEQHILTKKFDRSGMSANEKGHLSGIQHIDKILYAVKHKLPSSLASLVLARSYDNFHNTKTIPSVEDVLGQVLYRDSESTLDFLNINTTIKEYWKNDILKFYGLNIVQYLDMTRIERKVLVENAVIKMEQLDKAMSEIQNDKAKIKNTYIN